MTEIGMSVFLHKCINSETLPSSLSYIPFSSQLLFLPSFTRFSETFPWSNNPALPPLHPRKSGVIQFQKFHQGLPIGIPLQAGIHKLMSLVSLPGFRSIDTPTLCFLLPLAKVPSEFEPRRLLPGNNRSRLKFI